MDLELSFRLAEVIIVNRECTAVCANILISFEIRIGNKYFLDVLQLPESFLSLRNELQKLKRLQECSCYTA